MTIQKVKLTDLTGKQLQQWREQYAGKNVEIEIKIPVDMAEPISDPEMNEEKFWSIINLLDWNREGNDDAVIEPAVQELSRLSASAITTFYDLLSEKTVLAGWPKICRPFNYGQ